MNIYLLKLNKQKILLSFKIDFDDILFKKLKIIKKGLS